MYEIPMTPFRNLSGKQRQGTGEGRLEVPFAPKVASSEGVAPFGERGL